MVALAPAGSLALSEQQRAESVRRARAWLELCRRSLADYWTSVYPQFEIFAWQVHLCARLERFLQQVENGESPRLIIQAPPQHGKSMVVSRAFPAWILGKHPDWPLIIGSYAKSLAMQHGRWIRNTLNDDRHTSVFPDPRCRLSDDSKAVDQFVLEGDGQLLSRGVGGGTTGNPARIFIVDDPFADRQQAESQLIRDGVSDWFSSVVSTRLAPGGGVIVMNTRWHTDDLAGRLIAQSEADPEADQWEVLSYPAIAEAGDMLGRPLGAALGRYSVKQLAKMKRSMPARDWLSMYQQRPASATGGYFKVGMVNRLAGVAVPVLRRLYQAWDLALTPEQVGRGDYSVGVTVGVDHLGRYWLVDLVRGRWSPDQAAKQIINFQQKHGAKMVWMEGGPPFLGVQPSLVHEMRRSGLWIPYEAISHGGKAKDIRAIPLRGILNGGNLYVPADAPWWKELEIELASFPSGKTDDQVDALAYLFLKVNVLLADTDDRPLPKAPPAVERSRMVKRTYADIVRKAKEAKEGRSRDDW